MADPVVTITNGVPTGGTGTITTLGQTLVDGANATMGITTATAVVTDAPGTLQQYLRGLVKLFTSLSFTGANMNVNVTNANTNGQKNMAGSAPVVIASDQSLIPTKEVKSATGTQTSVASSATSVSVLASNANRLGATVFNDSTAVLYLLLVTGGTASNAVYTVQLAANAYYEVPFGYTGALIGIWATANGNARVTEMT